MNARNELTALGLSASRNLRVNEESLALYYDYLAAHLELPFVACYPRPSSPANVAVDRCEVIELLDPRTDLCDEFDGIYCRTRKGRFLVAAAGRVDRSAAQQELRCCWPIMNIGSGTGEAEALPRQIFLNRRVRSSGTKTHHTKCPKLVGLRCT